ncbi:MAG: class I SAM-dependent methyltransferase, partial [Mariprofundaceae bacterium]|nr:class I SAM-dependent methyltransferase [Mariprofundaceae bacterium]
MTIVKKLFRGISRSILLNPVWITEHYLYLALRRGVFNLGCSDSEIWLDIGCGTRPYEHLFSNVTYIGVDVSESGRPLGMKHPDLFYDGVSLPFPDACVDGIFCTQVLEHVSAPNCFLAECARVLKPGGKCLFSIPFVWEEHEEPHDY